MTIRPTTRLNLLIQYLNLCYLKLELLLELFRGAKLASPEKSVLPQSSKWVSDDTIVRAESYKEGAREYTRRFLFVRIALLINS